MPCPEPRGKDAMSATIGLDQEVFSYDVSDEALEAASGTKNEMAVRYTLYACTSVDCALIPQVRSTI